MRSKLTGRLRPLPFLLRFLLLLSETSFLLSQASYLILNYL